jgi:signal transduction histidine kinase
VLHNLLSNALRFTPEGGEITLSAERHGAEAWLRVRDSGPGIAHDDLPYVFERFYRTDKARQRLEGGTGLGLSIARSLVEAHGGRLWAESAPGQGATFVIALPVS